MAKDYLVQSFKEDFEAAIDRMISGPVVVDYQPIFTLGFISGWMAALGGYCQPVSTFTATHHYNFELRAWVEI